MPRCACASEVYGSVCVCVCVCVCDAIAAFSEEHVVKLVYIPSVAILLSS